MKHIKHITELDHSKYLSPSGRQLLCVKTMFNEYDGKAYTTIGKKYELYYDSSKDYWIINDKDCSMRIEYLGEGIWGWVNAKVSIFTADDTIDEYLKKKRFKKFGL